MKKVSVSPQIKDCFKRVTAVLATFICLMVPPAALAQSGAGSIQGTVTDASGAVIPNAKIHVVNAKTRGVTDTTSNQGGFFQVPGLFTSTYRMTVTAAEMKTYVTSTELLVAQGAVINPVLTPGSVTQEVVVNANSVQLTTNDSGAIDSTLENRRIN